MRFRLAFAALSMAALASACDSNGGVVTPNNPLNPTAAPTGIIVRPATPTPQPTTTPVPTATPTGAAPTATPAPTPTPTAPPALVCSAPPPDPNTGSITLTGAVQTATVPCFGTFLSTTTIPANTSAGATVAFAVSTDQAQGAVPNAAEGTPILYTSLHPSATIQFTSTTPAIATAITSATIGAPHTYAIQSYVPAFGIAQQTITGLVPTGHTVRFSLTPGAVFPAVQVIVILYRSS